MSALYAVNTAGAVTGAVLAGFYLIGAIGIERSFLVGAAVNVTVGGVALLFARRGEAASSVASESRPEPTPPSSRATAAAPMATIGAVVAVSGLVALALEIVWFRMLLQYLAATTYAFTTMLATVLDGHRDRRRDRVAAAAASARLDSVARRAAVAHRSRGAGLGDLSRLELSRGMADRWRLAGERLGDSAGGDADGYYASHCLARRRIAGARATRPVRLPGRVGRLYSLNVLGAIAGALLGGFLVLPLFGTRRGLIAMAAIYASTGLALMLAHARRVRTDRHRRRRDGRVFALLMARVPDPFAAAYERRYGRDMREFWRDEGVQTAVSVHASEFRRSLYLDGLHQANDTPEMVRLHRIIGLLPMAAASLAGRRARRRARRRRDQLARSASTRARRVQIVELSDSVRRAAPFFAHINYDVLNQPNVRVRVDDGRNFLLLSGETFDVITADIIQPIHAGAGNLYSREYFSLVRRALKPHGLALQWIGLRPPTQYRLIMRTFLDVFPDATLWLDGQLMVGSLEPLTISRPPFEAKRQDARTRAALDEIGLTSFDVLRSWYTGGPEELHRFVGPGPLLTDDRPLLEYHRSLSDDPEPLDLSGVRGDVSRIVRDDQR